MLCSVVISLLKILLLIKVLLTLFLLKSSSSEAAKTTPPLSIQFQFDAHNQVELHWLNDFERASTRFVFKLQLQSVYQWFAFGFADYLQFENSDFCIVSLEESIALDAFSDNSGNVYIDAQQDWRMLELQKQPTSRDSSSSSSDWTLVLERNFDTCDNQSDIAIDSGAMQLISMVSKSVFDWLTTTNTESSNENKDLLRSMQPIRLLQRQQKQRNSNRADLLPSDTTVLDVVVDQVEIPAQQTTYWCEIVKLPEFQEKNHIFKYEAEITPENIDVVHHIELFHCQHLPATLEHFSYSGICSQMPEEVRRCARVIAAWAIGAEPLDYPEEAGQPIGGSNFSRFVRLEIHYNNHLKQSGLIDNSGIRLYYSTSLRPYDSGVLEVGLHYIDTMLIPPRQKAFPLTGYCTSECTAQGLPDAGVVLWASQLHAHLAGRRLFTKHIRAGYELPEINRANHYSPHWQEIRPLDKPIHLLPGDVLQMTCIYDTSQRADVTVGGLSTSDEMCVNYIHYYPRVELELCKSSVSDVFLDRFFNDSRSNKSERNKNSWNTAQVQQLLSLYKNSPIDVQCNSSTGMQLPGDWKLQQIPQILHPIKAKEIC